MLKVNPKYIFDEKLNQKEVILNIKDWNKILKRLEKFQKSKKDSFEDDNSVLSMLCKFGKIN